MFCLISLSKRQERSVDEHCGDSISNYTWIDNVAFISNLLVMVIKIGKNPQRLIKNNTHPEQQTFKFKAVGPKAERLNGSSQL
jgi:hypothetical protein